MDTKWNGTNHDPGEDVEYYVASQIQDALEGAEAAPGVIQVTPKKHPRFRAWTGVLALLAGFALVAGSLGTAAGRWITGGDLEWWKGDWQETRAFASEVSGYMRDFLTLGAGGELTWYDTVLEGTVWETNGGWWGDTATTETAEEADTNTAPDAGYQSDKNVLYRITKDGEDLYTNTDWSLANPNSLPEGYSFLLVFKDGKAQAWKDGEELDLYGNGIYTRESPWYLPGYENFTAGEDVAGVEVRMAVREEPIPYLQGRYANGYVFDGNPLYNLYQGLAQARTFYLEAAVALAAGAALLVLSRHLRQDRRRAEAAIAAKTVYVGTELRFAAVVVCLLGVLWSVSFWNVFYMVQSALYRLGAGQWPDLISRGLSLVISLVLSNPVAVLALCLVVWLIHNDHRYNPKPRRSLLRSLLRSLRAKDLQRPVERRLTRRAAAPAAVLAAAGIGGVMVLLVGNKLWWWNIYGGYIAVTVVLYFLVLAFCCLCAWQQRPLARDLGVLCDRIAAVRSGNLTDSLALPEDADLHQAAEDLDNLRLGLQQALADQTRSERMKVELISNVSHDLKTPLTSILSYAELLRQEPLEGAAADYARIIDEKAQRLRAMVQDVFEVSKAAADQLPVHLERLDFAKLVRQTLADMADPIEKSGLAFRVELPEGEVPITADGKRMYRVFQNLIQNALQYALPGSRVYVTLTVSGSRAETAVRNTSRQELPKGVDFTARFVRGDASRTDGGSGLGLSIAKSFTEACGGQFRVETVADLFTAAVSFPLAGEGAPKA